MDISQKAPQCERSEVMPWKRKLILFCIEEVSAQGKIWPKYKISLYLLGIQPQESLIRKWMRCCSIW